MKLFTNNRNSLRIFRRQSLITEDELIHHSLRTFFNRIMGINIQYVFNKTEREN